LMQASARRDCRLAGGSAAANAVLGFGKDARGRVRTRRKPHSLQRLPLL
jgi:hypothetical protein